MGDFRSGPDFLCIGMPCSGTRWLYDNLQAHSDIEMPLIKELHFLDRGFRSRTLNNRLKKIIQRETNGRGVATSHRVFLERYAQAPSIPGLPEAEAAYLWAWKHGTAEETTFKPQAEHFDWYESLFEPYRPKMTGDVTPGYWWVGPDTIRTFNERYPHMRYIVMLRNPVSRTISSLNKQVHKGVFSLAEAHELIESPPSLPQVLANGELMTTFGLRSSQAIMKWAEIVGREAIQILTLDEVSKAPDRVRARIYDFLGQSAPASMIDETMTSNRKENRFPNLLTDADTSNLRHSLRAEIESCKVLVGDAVMNW